jgi:hypothetical protein
MADDDYAVALALAAADSPPPDDEFDIIDEYSDLHSLFLQFNVQYFWGR